MATESWNVISTTAFLDFMKRAKAGEDPDILMLEFIANSDSEQVEGE